MNNFYSMTMYELIKAVRKDKPLMGYKGYYGITKKQRLQQIIEDANKLIDVRSWVNIDMVDKIIGLPFEAYTYKDTNRNIGLSYDAMVEQLRYYSEHGKFRKISYYYPELVLA